MNLLSRVRQWVASIVAPTSVEIHYDDAEAIASDWKAVGDDIREAMRQYGRL